MTERVEQLIDLTAKQIPWLKDTGWLLEAVQPNEDALREYLVKEYRWWTGKPKGTREEE